MLGGLVGGRFAVIDVLGVGGFGAVYRALQQPVGRPVALKLIHPQLDGLEQVRSRFFREARVVAALNDPTVVTLFDYGEQPNGMIYMAFELVEGVALSQIIGQGPLPIERAASLLMQVLRALAVAHRRGLVHRDIKPANIMVRRDEFGHEAVKVLDFGIAKITQRSEGEEATLQTREGMMLGTPRYMAPEQARGGEVDARADLYAVGVLAYEVLTGRPPFVGVTPLEVAVAHVTQTPPPIDPQLGLPPALVQVVLKALAKAPGDRFETAAAMAEALGAAVPAARAATAALPTVPDGKASTHSLEAVAAPSWDEPSLEVAGAPRRWIVPAVLAVLAMGAAIFWMTQRSPTGGASAGAAQPVSAAPVRVPDAALLPDAAVPDAQVPDAARPAPDAAQEADARPPDAVPPDAAAPPTQGGAPPTKGPNAPASGPRRVRPPPGRAPESLEMPEF